MKTIGDIMGVDNENEDPVEIEYNPDEAQEALERAEALHRKTRQKRYTARELWVKLTGRSFSLLDDFNMRLTSLQEYHGTGAVIESLEFALVYHPGQRWEPGSLYNYILIRLEARRADAANIEVNQTAEDIYVDRLTRHMRDQGRKLTAKATIQEVLRNGNLLV